MNPILALIIANIIWGIGLPIQKLALQNVPPFTLAFLRFFIACLIIYPFLHVNIKSVTKKDWWEIGLGAFFGIFINIVFLFWGLQKASSINGGVIASSAPILLFFSSIIFLHEKADQKVLSGMILSLLGVFIIILLPLFYGIKTSDEINTLEGNIYYIITMVGAVIGPIFLKGVLQKVNALTVTFYGFLFSSIMFLPFMLWEMREWNFAQMSPAGLGGVLFAAVGSSVIAYYLHNYGLARMHAQEIGIFTYLVPVASVVVAIPLLHEYPDIYFVIGSVLVFIGIMISEYHKKVQKRRSVIK